jgi:hypothetical protein
LSVDRSGLPHAFAARRAELEIFHVRYTDLDVIGRRQHLLVSLRACFPVDAAFLGTAARVG